MSEIETTDPFDGTEDVPEDPSLFEWGTDADWDKVAGTSCYDPATGTWTHRLNRAPSIYTRRKR